MPDTTPTPPPSVNEPVVEEDRDLETDHEQFAGETIADPWTDPGQPDWPDADPINAEEV